MENQDDVLRNPESFMQVGDIVAFSFTLTSIALLAISVFILIQLRNAPKLWKLPILIGTIVTLVSALMAYIRRDYWITTLTDPVEFRFIDWFLTVPLMATAFYYLLKPLGAKRWMPVRLYLAGFWMISWGYLGEAIYPENSFYWGLLGSLGFAAIIMMIMMEGYPRVLRQGVNPDFKQGYLALSLFLPFAWSVYPIGYMTVPGNIWEGGLGVDTIAVLYNLADIASKGGLALGIVFIASKVGNDVLLNKKVKSDQVEPAEPEVAEDSALDNMIEYSSQTKRRNGHSKSRKSRSH